MKIKSFLFSIIVHSLLCAYDCDCFDLNSHFNRQHTLYNSLHNCIRFLPETDRFEGIDGLHGITYRITANNDFDFSEVVEFYFYKQLDTFSAKKISQLFAMMRRDYEKEINSIIKWKKNQLQDFIS